MSKVEFVPVTRGVMNRYLHTCGFIEYARQDIDQVQTHLRCRACKAVHPGGWSVLYTRHEVAS